MYTTVIHDICLHHLVAVCRHNLCERPSEQVVSYVSQVEWFVGGWGASYMARLVGQKKAREIWFLCRQYNAQEALDMGLVNTVVPYADLEKETVRWCREMLRNSPSALRCLKAALNADCDGQSGLQELAGNATMLFYMTEEGQEGRNAFNEKRAPDFSKFRRNP